MQLDRLACIATRYGGGRQPVMSSASGLSCMSAPPPVLMQPLDLDMNVYSRHFGEQQHGAIDHMVMQQQMGGSGHGAGPSYMHAAMAPVVVVQEQDRQLVLELASTAADHLARMCRTGEPLWAPRRRSSGEVMDADEHARTFTWPGDAARQQQGDAARPARTEGTRDSAVVIMNSITLVDAFLNAVRTLDAKLIFPQVRPSIKLGSFTFFCPDAEQVDGAVPFDRVQGKNHSGDTQRSCFWPCRHWVSHLGNYFYNDFISDVTS
jgi:hypothetical protein